MWIFFKSESLYLNLQERVKQAFLLYDQVVFQEGMYLCKVGPSGSIENYGPYDEDLYKKVGFENENKSENFWVKLRGSNSASDAPSVPFIYSKQERSFRAQFHTLTEEIYKNGLDNFDLVEVDSDVTFMNTVRKMTERDKRINKRSGDMSERLWNLILTNLNRDLVASALHGWTASVDPLHFSLISNKMPSEIDPQGSNGFLSMEVLVPDVKDLSWEEIAKIREDSALSEFRIKMVEFESKARDMIGVNNEKDIKKEMQKILTSELLKEIENLRVSPVKYVGNIALELFGSIIPPLGTINSLGAFVSDTHDQLKQRNSWITAFMKLTQK